MAHMSFLSQHQFRHTVLMILITTYILLLLFSHMKITQDSFHEAAVGVDIVSVAPVSPFKAPLIQFTNHTSSSVVAGFMPAIFYSVEANGRILISLFTSFCSFSRQA